MVFIAYQVHGEVSDEPLGIEVVHIGGGGAVTLIIGKDLTLAVLSNSLLSKKIILSETILPFLNQNIRLRFRNF